MQHQCSTPPHLTFVFLPYTSLFRSCLWTRWLPRWERRPSSPPDIPDDRRRACLSPPLRRSADGPGTSGSAPSCPRPRTRSEEHTYELQSIRNLVCLLLLVI